VKRVFVDSGGFFAHLVAEDVWHDRATALFQAARSDSWRLMTTNAVLFETYALLLSRTAAGRRHAIAFDRHFREYGRITIL
jgi:predicted nucleic acid-binding protein